MYFSTRGFHHHYSHWLSLFHLHSRLKVCLLTKPFHCNCTVVIPFCTLITWLFVLSCPLVSFYASTTVVRCWRHCVCMSSVVHPAHVCVCPSACPSMMLFPLYLWCALIFTEILSVVHLETKMHLLRLGSKGQRSRSQCDHLCKITIFRVCCHDISNMHWWLKLCCTL